MDFRAGRGTEREKGEAKEEEETEQELLDGVGLARLLGVQKGESEH